MEIKEKIINRINEIEDPLMLKMLYRLVSTEPEMEPYEMTKEELQSIEKGVSDFENGRWFTPEETDNIYMKWRNEKLNGL